MTRKEEEQRRHDPHARILACVIAALSLVTPGAVAAQESESGAWDPSHGRLILELRPRYNRIDESDKPERTEGGTVRLIAGFVSAPLQMTRFMVEGIHTDATVFRYVAGFFAVAMLEELIFRAVLFRLIETSLGSVIAIALSTAGFGLAHLLNPNATWIGIASLTLSSLVVVGGFLLTRRLWFCVGLHWAWNLLQALYSVSVSGMGTKGLLDGHVTGPAWLTGGSFGVEASLPTLLLSLIAASFLLRRAHQKGHFTPPYWRSR